MNGGGTFIFCTPARYDTKFYLFMLRLAMHYGKKTYLVNAMFSDGTNLSVNIDMQKECRKILSKITFVSARDLCSLRYYKENIAENIEYVPDALFSWIDKKHYFSLCYDYPLVGVTFPEYSEKIISFKGGMIKQ